MPLLGRRKSRNALSPPPSSPSPPTPTPPQLPLSSFPDGGKGLQAARPFHLPFAYSNAPQAGPAVADGGVPRSSSEPTGFAGGGTANPSFSSFSPAHPPPTFPTPAFSGSTTVLGGSPSRQSIASLYPSPNLPSSSSFPPTSSPSFLSPSASSPAALSTHSTIAAPLSPGRTLSTRRPRRPLKDFTILLVGASSTGKTSFAQALFEVFPSPTGGGREEHAKERDEAGEWLRRTSKDVLLHDGDKVRLTVLNTDGLDVPLPASSSSSSSLDNGPVGQQLSLDSRMRSLVAVLEHRFNATLRAETSLSRTPPLGSSGGEARGAKGGEHVHLCLYFVHPGTMQRGKGGSAGKDWVVGEADKRVVRRLSERVTVLPILALSDTLTFSSLSRAKAAVTAAFSSSSTSTSLMDAFFLSNSSASSSLGATHSFSSSQNSTSSPSPGNEAEEEDSDTETVKVVHLKRSRSSANHLLPGSPPSRSRSVSRRRKTGRPRPGEGAEAEQSEEEKRWTEGELRGMWPFAVVTPDWDADAEAVRAEGAEGGVASKSRLRREYRHATLDVLNPEHCDFLPLFQALSNGERVEHLRVHTSLAFYEPFRTARLLAGREEQRRKSRAGKAMAAASAGGIGAGGPGGGMAWQR
ncbi:hypothetical protein JCM8547_006339 [Rhodosporidiobolus lusitaniae]